MGEETQTDKKIQKAIEDLWILWMRGKIPFIFFYAALGGLVRYVIFGGTVRAYEKSRISGGKDKERG